MRNINEIFRKDIPYDNIKSHKKQGFPLLLEYTFFEKLQEGAVKLTLPPSRFRVKQTLIQLAKLVILLGRVLSFNLCDVLKWCCLNECIWTQTNKHLVYKQTLNHLVKLSK